MIGFPVSMLVSQRSFMLLKNSFSESARMSLEWSTVFTSFSNAGDSLIGIQSPVCVPSYKTFSNRMGNFGPGFPCRARRKLRKFFTRVILPRNKERMNPPCSQESVSHWSWASHSSSEGSPVSIGSPDSSKVRRSGSGWGFALPSRMQVQRTNASRLMRLAPNANLAAPSASRWKHSRARAPAPHNRLSTQSSHAVGVQQYFTGFARFQALHGFGEVFHGDAVGDHGMQIEFAGFEQSGHLVPGLIHAASVDALHRDAFENNIFGKIQRDGPGGQAEQGNHPAAAHDIESCANRVGMASHFENHVHAQAARLFHHNRAGIFFRRIEDVIGLHLARDFAPMLVHFDGKYAGRAGGPGHGNRKQPDWSASRDGHGFGGDLSRQHRVNRIAQRIEN